MSDNTSFGVAGSGGGGGGGAVTAASGAYVAGSVVDLQTLLNLLNPTAFDNTHEVKTSIYGKNAAAGDTPVLLDASGRPLVSLAQIAGVNPQMDGGSSNRLGVSLYGKNAAAGDTPFLLNSDGTINADIHKVLGNALSVNNPLIDADVARYALMNGTLYSLGLTATSTGASSAAIAIFGGVSGISKNTLILSVYGSSIGNQVVLKAGTIAALDTAVATNTTPVPLKAGGSASLYTGANAAINAPTGTSNPAYTGSFFRFITEQANVAQELAMTGIGIYYIPANTANAGFEIVLVQGSAAGVYTLNLVWAEF